MLTHEQKIQRCYGLGGSDIAAIFGLSKYKTPYQLYLEKRLPGEEPFVAEDKTSLPAEIGSFLESKIIDLYTEKTGASVQKECPMKYHKDFPYLFANIDGLLENGAILEAKSTEYFLKKEWGDAGTAAIPKPYLLQVAYYCHIYDAPYADIAVLFGKSEFEVYRYNRHNAFEEEIIKGACRFWQEHVQKRIPPNATSIKDLTLRYPEGSEIEQITASLEILEYVNTYNRLSYEIQLLEEKREKYKLDIAAFMEDHETLVNLSGDRIATYKFSERKSLNTTNLKKELPEIYNKYLETKIGIRSFRLWEPKVSEE